MSAANPFVCSTCPATFKYKKHLQRHQASHSSDRPYRCIFCNSDYKRRDVLRKHFRTCAPRILAGHDIPAECSPRKPITSCDHCAAQKKPCDSARPCAACMARGQICSYDRFGALQSDASKAAEESINLDSTSSLGFEFLETTITASDIGFSDPGNPEWYHWPQARPYGNEAFLSSNPDHVSPSPWHLKEGSKFDFLLNFTRTSGLRSVFNYRRPKHVSPTIPSTWAAGPQSVAATVPSLMVQPDHCVRQQLWGVTEAVNGLASQVELDELIHWLDDPVFVRTNELWQLFRPYLYPSDVNNTSHHTYSEGQCLRFFRPQNLKRFVCLFFDDWYPHCPMLHQPTFDIMTCPALLLAPVIVLGACMSDDPEERGQGKRLGEVVEQIVFSHPLLSLHLSGGHHDDLDLSPIKVMQAAYLVCLLQYWEGDDRARKRIRQYRFITLIATARDIGFSSANHNYRDPEPFVWRHFIEREETIRTFTYIFLLDSAFLIFNNAPPKLMLQELDINLACPEEIFQAASADRAHAIWLSVISKQRPATESLSLATAVRSLASPRYTSESAQTFARMTSLNLFTIISSLHIVLFQHRTLFLCPPTNLNMLRHAIDRWMVAWNDRHLVQTSSTPQIPPWCETGFMKHAHEFAQLALARLDNLDAERNGKPEDVMGLSAFADCEAAPADVVSQERLDEYSMSQVELLLLSLTINQA